MRRFFKKKNKKKKLKQIKKNKTVYQIIILIELLLFKNFKIINKDFNPYVKTNNKKI